MGSSRSPDSSDGQRPADAEVETESYNSVFVIVVALFGIWAERTIGVFRNQLVVRFPTPPGEGRPAA